MSCITANELPCVSAMDEDVGYMDLSMELQPGETISAVTVTDEALTLDISDAGPNLVTLYLQGRTVGPGKAAEWRFEMASPADLETAFAVQVTTTLGRIKNYRGRIRLEA